MEEKPKRRWLRFSLSTLLIAVTFLCMWLGWQWQIVQERNNVRHHFKDRVSFRNADDGDPFGLAPEPVRLSWIREAMGDRPVWSIIYHNLEEIERERIRRAFPEADILGDPFSDDAIPGLSDSTDDENPFGGQ